MRSDEPSVLFRHQIPRWIAATFLKMIESKINRFNTGKIKMLVEADVTLDTIKQNPELFVVQVECPTPKQLAALQLRYITTLTIIITTHRKQDDIYAHERTIGVANECFPNCIPVLRYGDGPLDNVSLAVGLLEQVSDPKPFGYGAAGPDTPVYQSSISAQYRMDFQET